MTPLSTTGYDNRATRSCLPQIFKLSLSYSLFLSVAPHNPSLPPPHSCSSLLPLCSLVSTNYPLLTPHNTTVSPLFDFNLHPGIYSLPGATFYSSFEFHMRRAASPSNLLVALLPPSTLS
jgi:hypothetical protein